MMDYRAYLERVIETAEAYDEERFNAEVVPLFPKVEDINWDEYWSLDENAITYIFHYGVFKDMSSITVTDYNIETKEVILDGYGIECFEDLDEVIKRLNENGWKINEDNLNEIREDLIPQAKEDILDKIKAKATLDQLESFYQSLES